MTALAGWIAAYPSRPGAPLVLPGPTLADALGPRLRPKPPVLPERLAVLLPMLAADLAARQIARRLGISPDAVHGRLARLYAVLGVHNRVSAVTTALASGLLAGARKDDSDA